MDDLPIIENFKERINYLNESGIIRGLAEVAKSGEIYFNEFMRYKLPFVGHTIQKNDAGNIGMHDIFGAGVFVFVDNNFETLIKE